MEWLNQHTGPDEMVMAQLWSTVHYYTGRPAVRLPVTRDRRTLLTTLRSNRVAYLLILDAPDDPYYRPTEVDRLAILQAEAGPDAFESVYRFPIGTIYRVK
jgi:hypothetical protein